MDNLNDPINYEQVGKSDFEELIKILIKKKYLSIPENKTGKTT